VDIPLFTRTQTAEQIPIDGSSLGIEAITVQDAIVQLLASSNAGPVRVEYRTITALEFQTKSLFLQATPANTQQVAFDILEGVPQLIGSDFNVVNTTLSWGDGELSTLIEEGDVVRIVYSTFPDYQILHVEITQDIIDAKSYSLPTRAYYPEQVTLDVIGGMYQINGIDFTVSEQIVSWDGTDLEAILEVGDYVRIAFLG
jgi:hypothetical protein